MSHQTGIKGMLQLFRGDLCLVFGGSAHSFYGHRWTVSLQRWWCWFFFCCCFFFSFICYIVYLYIFVFGFCVCVGLMRKHYMPQTHNAYSLFLYRDGDGEIYYRTQNYDLNSSQRRAAQSIWEIKGWIDEAHQSFYWERYVYLWNKGVALVYCVFLRLNKIKLGERPNKFALSKIGLFGIKYNTRLYYNIYYESV